MNNSNSETSNRVEHSAFETVLPIMIMAALAEGAMIMWILLS